MREHRCEEQRDLPYMGTVRGAYEVATTSKARSARNRSRRGHVATHEHVLPYEQGACLRHEEAADQGIVVYEIGPQAR